MKHDVEIEALQILNMNWFGIKCIGRNMMRI